MKIIERVFHGETLQGTVCMQESVDSDSNGLPLEILSVARSDGRPHVTALWVPAHQRRNPAASPLPPQVGSGLLPVFTGDLLAEFLPEDEIFRIYRVLECKHAGLHDADIMCVGIMQMETARPDVPDLAVTRSLALELGICQVYQRRLRPVQVIQDWWSALERKADFYRLPDQTLPTVFWGYKRVGKGGSHGRK